MSTANDLLEAKMGKKVDHNKLVTNMIDSIALLGQASHELTMLRRRRLQPALKQDYTARCSMDILLSKYLFGDDLAKRLAKSAKLYTCFIDFEKAFDRVPRNCLLQKLCKNGIKGKFLKTIENMYQNDNACVRIGDKVTETFPINIGVKQGDNPSPTLFNFYLSDLPEIFNSNDTCPPLLQDGTPVGSLLWADDLVILSKIEIGLRTALKNLKTIVT